jgi:hypothetical protein
MFFQFLKFLIYGDLINLFILHSINIWILFKWEWFISLKFNQFAFVIFQNLFHFSDFWLYPLYYVNIGLPFLIFFLYSILKLSNDKKVRINYEKVICSLFPKTLNDFSEDWFTERHVILTNYVFYNRNVSKIKC